MKIHQNLFLAFLPVYRAIPLSLGSAIVLSINNDFPNVGDSLLAKVSPIHLSNQEFQLIFFSGYARRLLEGNYKPWGITYGGNNDRTKTCQNVPETAKNAKSTPSMK